jgi:anti-repressor protein
MTDIQIFSNPQFGEIRTLADEANEPLFCAADVCKALGYTNPRKAVADHVSEDDVTKRDTIDNLGRIQTASFVN